MAKSSSIGLLKNVSTAAGSACPRQEAAQIIYNALTLPILEANVMGVLVPSNDTILSKYLGGSSDVVVVTGNEYADLNGTEPLEEGKTEVDNDTTLNWSTTLDMIGQSYKVWTVGNTVVYSEDAGNTVYETNEATTPDGITAKQAGMKLDGAEQYINYSPKYVDTYTTDIRVTYVYITKDEDGKEVRNPVEIPAGTALTETQLDQLKAIFKYASYETVGYVTVGTKDVTAANDVSNEMSWNKFVKEYITVETSNTINAKVNKNGNTIKVIDNDGDGVADYILKTEYVMDQITAIDGRGTYTLTGTDKEDKAITVAADAMATEDELAKGDVIVYALIDGVYYANLAETATVTVDSINYKAITITCGDETYQQSGIDNDTVMLEDLIKMEKKASYNVYFDNYGYIRAFVEARYGDYVLLTEMYRDTTDRNNLIKDANYTAEAVTADGEAANYNVVAGVNTFYAGIGNGLNKALNQTDDSVDSWTNVADAAISGSDISLASAEITYNYKNNKHINTEIYDLTAQIGTAITKGQRHFYTADKADYVNITADTLVYLVYGSGENRIEKVTVGTGYAAIPALDNTNKLGINAVYAVATDTRYDNAGATYPVADVLVIEIKNTYDKDFVFGVQNYTKTVDAILSDGTQDDVADTTGVFSTIKFYDTVNGDLQNSFSYDKQVEAYNVHEINELRDYIDLNPYSDGEIDKDVTKVVQLSYDETLPVYIIKGGVTTTASAKNIGVAGIEYGDDLIVVWTDNRKVEVAYIIDKTQSSSAVTAEFNRIAGIVIPSTYTLKVNADKGITVVADVKDGEEVTVGTKFNFTATVKPGYQLVSGTNTCTNGDLSAKTWTDNTEFTFGKVQGDIVINGQTEAIEYTVTFDLTNATVTDADNVVIANGDTKTVTVEDTLSFNVLSGTPVSVTGGVLKATKTEDGLTYTLSEVVGPVTVTIGTAAASN
jgi:hypothetical protein